MRKSTVHKVNAIYFLLSDLAESRLSQIKLEIENSITSDAEKTLSFWRKEVLSIVHSLEDCKQLVERINGAYIPPPKSEEVL